jgi:predicted alpha/beta hydrolase family esterase
MKKKDQAPPLLKFVRWFFPKLERIAPFLAHRYFLKIFFTPLQFPVPEKERKAKKFARLFNLTVDEKNIHLYSWGEGKEFVLCIHGWAGRGTQFRRFVKPLMKEGYRVVAFDGPAHGQSDGKKTQIIEFGSVLKKIYEHEGIPTAIIAHSFGGSAALFAAMNGLPVRRLINIGSPTIGDEIIRTYLRNINGSWATGEYFKRYMLKTFGKPFDEFTALHFVKHLPEPVSLLLVHDEDDKEVIMKHPEELIRIYPSARLLRTTGLGHTRILKDDGVIAACVTFVKEGRLP